MPRSRTSSRDNIPKPTGSGQNQDHADSRPNREQKTPDPVRLVASLQQITQIEKVTAQGPTSSLGELRSGAECEGGGVCAPDPTLDSFQVYRNRRGKLVQNVWVDTHDLLNEAGGFTFNLRHGPLSTRELKLHLCIRQKKPCVSPALSQAGGEGLVATTQPGTLTITDDYAREIFRAIQGNHELKTVSARLEINDKEDPYDFKPYKSTPPTKDFLTRFIQVCPTLLTKFIVEMPGLSAVYLPEWKFLMEQQICLQVLICNFGVVMWHLYERTIIQNSTTLERIVLRRVQTFDSVRGIYIPMKWQIFFGCKRLEHLKVTCGFKRSSSAIQEPAHPNHVFLHERLDALPKHPSFAEFHVAKIWIDACALQDLTNSRPNLAVCLNCYDMEYSDGDLPPELCPNARGDVNELRMVTISRLDLQAEFPPHLAIESGSTNDERQKKRRRRPRDERNQKRLTKIIIFLFVIILLALAVLFIIIFFKHWRKVEDPETLAITSAPEDDDLRGDSTNSTNNDLEEDEEDKTP